ncbi:TPA: hypothetical protein EYP75_01655 [Candidatus Bathyarchaeota archaeon]|nr:hypothetical protein [Candidatus Bathyarchaeota archaeon]
MNVEKIRGLERTFRIRIGEYRVIFFVDKTERTIYVTHARIRKRIYKGSSMQFKTLHTGHRYALEIITTKV